jgi:hypothetical protein
VEIQQALMAAATTESTGKGEVAALTRPRHSPNLVGRWERTYGKARLGIGSETAAVVTA